MTVTLDDAAQIVGIPVIGKALHGYTNLTMTEASKLMKDNLAYNRYSPSAVDFGQGNHHFNSVKSGSREVNRSVVVIWALQFDKLLVDRMSKWTTPTLSTWTFSSVNFCNGVRQKVCRSSLLNVDFGEVELVNSSPVCRQEFRRPSFDVPSVELMYKWSTNLLSTWDSYHFQNTRSTTIPSITFIMVDKVTVDLDSRKSFGSSTLRRLLSQPDTTSSTFYLATTIRRIFSQPGVLVNDTNSVDLDRCSIYVERPGRQNYCRLIP
ncbi:hypothetical protein QJS10_CPA01g01782 [Acorus calamus]|uniref:Uncharacterized protein n=1 Tax=Acorus calamus TaxID=4465 RepID=A0AAV9FHH9_ACOCL|nr:hypothetical protein QJS10_CPA01g01782 [Acorus calamus]